MYHNKNLMQDLFNLILLYSFISGKAFPLLLTYFSFFQFFTEKGYDSTIPDVSDVVLSETDIDFGHLLKNHVQEYVKALEKVVL